MTDSEGMISTNAATTLKLLLGPGLLDNGPQGKPAPSMTHWQKILGVADEEEPWRRSLVAQRFVATAVIPLGQLATYQSKRVSNATQSAIDDAISLVGKSVTGLQWQDRLDMRSLCGPSSALSVVEELIEEDWRPIPGELLTLLRDDLDGAIATLQTQASEGEINSLLMAPLSDAVENVHRSISVSLEVGGLIGLGGAMSEASAASTRLVAAASSDRVDQTLVDSLVVVHGLAVAADMLGLVPDGAGNVVQLGISAAMFAKLGAELPIRSKWPKVLSKAFEGPKELEAGPTSSEANGDQ